MNCRSRVAELRTELQNTGADAFVTLHLPNIRYLTGFSGSNGLLFVTRTKSFFLTDFRYQDQVAEEVTADETIIGQGSLVELAAKKRIFSGARTIAFERTRLSVAQYDELATKTGIERLTGTDGIVEEIRSVKDGGEVERAARAAAISDKVFQKILGILKPGIREMDVSAEISYLHKKFGAEGDAFDTIVASGERGSLPHGRASEKKIASGEFVTLDFGCVVHGYHSDMTRTVGIGAPTKEMRSVYTIVRDAQRKALDAIRAGSAAKDIDNIARSHIAKKGYGEFFGHSLGHGVGLEIHENLRLSAANKNRLKEGNLVTVEPGIYLPKKFGVRIEEMAVVRRDGCEILTSSPNDLIVL